MKKKVLLSVILATAGLLVSEVAAQPGGGPGIRPSESAVRQAKKIPKPRGLYVVNEASNGQSTATAYAWEPGAPPSDYQGDITGHAIFVPLAQVLPSVTTWGQFEWDWTYLDNLVQIAVSNQKKFSVALEVGFQNLINCGPAEDQPCYLYSLPAGFAAACGVDCAPLFDVWTASGTCISAYVLLPWNTNVQALWTAAAKALKAHLVQTGVDRYLRLIHVPGLSIYDEELRLPTGFPMPPSSAIQPCPDGRPAYPTATNLVGGDENASNWISLGYSDASLLNGFKTIASAFAEAFPNRYLGLSLFYPGKNDNQGNPVNWDFPSITGTDPVGYVASQIVQEVTALAPGRVQLQSDNIDTDTVLPEVTQFASTYATRIGWQTNKSAGKGAACFDPTSGTETTCVDLGQAGVPYYDILQEGSVTGGTYAEVWSGDVVKYPQSFAAAIANHLY